MKPITITIAVLFVVNVSVNAEPLPQTKLSLSTISPKNATGLFGAFHVHRQGDFAALNWDVLSDDIIGFSIERSYDGEFFDKIADVEPASGKGRWNRYIDNTVEPGIIYYRILAITETDSEYSPVEMVKIVKHK